MNTPKIRLPRPLYYSLIMVITELILVSGAVLILLPTGFLKQFPLDIFGYLLLYKTIIAALAIIIIAHNRWGERLAIVKGGGLFLGHFVGFLLGGILGGRYGGVFWGIVGAVGLYLLVGRIGAMISSAIGNLLDRLSPSPEQADTVGTIQPLRPNALLLTVYAIIVPALFLLIAILLNSAAVPVGEYPEELSIGRIVVIALSLISIILPWLLRSRWGMKPATSLILQENAIFILGMVFSITPVIYGFFLFIAFGASIVELSLFAVASSLAAILWSANTNVRQQNAG